MGVPDGNSKIATVAPLIISQCTLSPKISPIAPAVQAVGGAASDFGIWGSPHLIIRLRLYSDLQTKSLRYSSGIPQVFLKRPT